MSLNYYFYYYFTDNGLKQMLNSQYFCQLFGSMIPVPKLDSTGRLLYRLIACLVKNGSNQINKLRVQYYLENIFAM